MAGARQQVPAGLAEMAPGPGLAGILAGLDPCAVSGFDTVSGARAARRQLNAAEAVFLSWVVEVERRDPTPEDPMHRLDQPDEWAPDELRAALALTRAASAELSLYATAVVVRLPALHAAMSAGLLDREKARLFTTMTSELSDPHAGAVCAALLPDVERLSTGQLRERIARRAITLDPHWAARRYKAGLQEMDVYGHANPDGTANLVGRNLPKDRTAAASGRINALAKAAKRGGDPRPIGHIRVWLLLGLTDGTYAGLTDPQILAHLATERLRHATEDAEGATEDPAEDSTEDTAEPTTQSGEVALGGQTTPDGEAAPDWDGSRAKPVLGVVVKAGKPPEPPGPGPERAESPRIGVELQVRLSTLMHLDQYPAELAGFGPIHPTYARDLLPDLGAAQWRFAITDTHGYLITGGLTPTRPTGIRARSARCQAIVELQIPTTLLHALLHRDPSACQDIDPNVLDAWDPVLADINRRIHTANRPGAPPTDGTDDPTRRTPRADLARDIRMRRRGCIGVCCRAPARTLDLDHTKNHAHGGLTIRVNLAPACGHDHALKHEGGWILRVIADHTYEWTSRLGHIYIVTTPPVLDELPEPMPDPTPAEPYEPTVTSSSQPDDNWADSTCWRDLPATESRPAPEPPPPPLPPELDIPPF